MDKQITNRHLQEVTKTSNLISWSRNGFIAYIPPTSTSKDNLLLTYLENINGVTWQLSKPLPINVKIDNNGNTLPQLSLVSWSTLSTDLAICDIYGNFYILLAGVALLEPTLPNAPNFELTSYNHMEMIYRDIINPDINSPVNPGASVVAFKWLNTEKPQILNKPANKVTIDGSSFVYAYGVNQFQAHGVCHPIATKQGIFILRKNGQLMLYYQGEHKVEYYKVVLDLGDEFQNIEKASIGFTNDKQVIVTTWDSISNNITTYSIDVNWGFLAESAKQQKLNAHYHTPKEAQKPPKLTLKKIHQMKPMEFYQEEEDGELSSIDVISSNPDTNSKLSILITYDSSIIYRYVLENNSVSDAFTNLGAEKNVQWNGNETPTVTLKNRIIRKGEIEAITAGFLDYNFTIIYKNGTVDVIDTTNWTIINHQVEDNSPQQISTIYDIGFDFPKIDNTKPLIMAVSPNMSCIVHTEIYTDSPNLTIKTFERVKNKKVDPQELYTTAVGFGFRHAYALYTSAGSDDLILLIQSEIQRIRNVLTQQDNKSVETIVQNFVGSIVSESHKAINFLVDQYSKESIDKLLSNNASLQKLLSLQYILGEVEQNYKISDISWTVMNLRSASLGIMFSLSSIYRQVTKKKPSEDTFQDSVTRAECISSLLGNFKWMIDLMTYLNQELLQLSNMKNNNNNSNLNISNSIAIPMIMGKVPRLFLMYSITSMGRTHEILKKLNKDLAEANKLFTPMKESLTRYFTICNNAPLTVNLFENYLRECDALMTKELSTRLLGKEKGYSLKLEQKIICQGEIPDDLKDIPNMLLDRYAVNTTREMKLSDLYFYDTAWLNIGVNRRNDRVDIGQVLNQTPKKLIPRWLVDGHCVDTLRKIFIFEEKDTVLRKCTRCRAVSLVGDYQVFDSPTPIGSWTMVFQRNCICGNPWVNGV
ncbi:SIN4 Mediator of RNA polymerase II transcription subunit 16 [Candida maltosa Xu316]